MASVNGSEVAPAGSPEKKAGVVAGETPVTESQEKENNTETAKEQQQPQNNGAAPKGGSEETAEKSSGEVEVVAADPAVSAKKSPAVPVTTKPSSVPGSAASTAQKTADSAATGIKRKREAEKANAAGAGAVEDSNNPLGDAELVVACGETAKCYYAEFKGKKLMISLGKDRKLLAAKTSTVRVGDTLVYINNINVEKWKISRVVKLLATVTRPVTLGFVGVFPDYVPLWKAAQEKLEGMIEVGTFIASCDAICTILGSPHRAYKEHGVYAWWGFSDEAGVSFTLNDYNTEGSVVDEKRFASEMREWYVGGHGLDSLTLLCKLLQIGIEDTGGGSK